ncbi:MAG: DPP IV N-terminal domain-containing protein, partial [Pyrinomonadaceae bacterium]
TRIAWSPDGKMIACAASSADADGYYHNVVGVSVEDGSEKPLTSQRWGSVAQVAWQADGSGLVMIAMAGGGGREATPAQLWQLSYPGGEARRITNDLNRYRDVSLTADASALVTVQTNRISNIWVAPKGDEGRARQITSGTLDGSSGLTWTPDSRIVYASDASGKQDIWIMNADGSNQRQLTHDGVSKAWPAVSTDGRSIIFTSTRSGRTNIWRMDADGGNPKQLTDGNINVYGHPSPDGRWVVYTSMDHGNATVWRVPIDGGQPVRLSDPTSNLPVVSPDGKQIVCFYWDEQASPPRGAMILPFEGGPPTRRFNIGPHAGGFVLHWKPDSRAILYIGIRLTNIWSQPVDGGEPVQLTHFQGDQVFNFDYSPDGKWLAIARGRVTDDVVLISDFR